MDAAHKLLTKTALFLATVLLLAVPGRAQQLVVSSTTVALNDNQARSITVTSSTTTAINYTLAGVPFWLSTFSSNNFTTTDTLSFQLASTICGTCTAPITLHPTSGGGTDVVVTVSYAPGGGGGNGSLVASPSSLTFSAFSGQAATSQNITLSTTSQNPISFTTASDQTWLTSSVSSFSLSSTVPATVTVFATAAALANGSYTGHITITPNVGTATIIPVTFNVGTGGGGTGTIFANPSSLTFSAQPGQTAAQQNVSLTSSTTGVTISNITSNVNWLSLSNVQLGQSIPLTMGVTANAAALTTGTYNAQLTVIPNTGTSTTISITFIVGTGGGGGSTGTITGSPTVSQFAYPNGTLNGQITIGSSNAAVTTFNLTISSQSNWLLFQNVGTGNYSNLVLGTYQLAVNTVVAATLQSGTYSATLTLTNPSNLNDITTVNLTLTVNGGTGGGGALTVSPSPVVFTASPGGASQSQNLTVTVANNATVTLNVTSFNSGFFSISSPACNGTPNPSFSCTFSGSQNLTITVNPANLSTLGLYSASLVFASGNSTQTVGLNLNLIAPVTTLTVNPTSLSFTAAAGGAAQSQDVTVAVPANATVTASLSSFNGNFFSVSSGLCNANPVSAPSCSFSGNQTLLVTVNPAFLTNAGNYNGSIVLQSGGVSVTVTVALTLTSSGNGGGPTGAIAAPASLTFAYQTGSNTFVPQQVITVGPVGTFTATASVSTTLQWLVINPVANTGSGGGGFVTVTVSPQGLPAGPYQGQITITSASGTMSIPVNLTVTASVVVEATPGNIYTPYQAGGAAIQQNITLFASDNSSTPVSVTTSTPWITLGTPTSPTTSSSFNVTLNPSGLCNGLNAGSITVSAPNAANNGFTIPVTVLVSGNTATSGCTGGTGPLSITPSSLTFTAQVNGVQPGGQSLSVVAPSSSTGYTVTFTVQSGGFNWLTVSPPGTNGNGGTLFGTQSLVVSVNQANLPLGTYSGTIAFNTGGQVQTVPVSLIVNTTGGSSVLTTTPPSLSFSSSGGTAPASQALTVTSTSGASGVTFTYQVTGNVPITATQGGVTVQNGQTLTTPANLIIGVSVSGLATGTYNGTITLSPTSGTGALQVPVTLSVTAATVTASPTTVTFTYNAGSAAPSPQTVQVSGTSGSTFTATASSSGNWLSVSPAAGTTPASLSVSVNPTGLTANTYTGTITVTGTGSATGTTTITVTLTITAPLPTITSVGSAASYIGGSISPGEVITIFGTSIGPTPGVTLALDPATGKVSTSLGGVQVKINGFLSPMVFASNTQVSAVVPYEICASSCGPGTIAQVIVIFLGQSSNGIPTQVVATAPGIFTANASGSGPGAILNANLSVNSPANPANKGDVVAIYMTGEGLTSPAGVTGKVTTVAPAPPLTPVPLLPVAVLIDGQPAAISFAGEAPGLVSGVMQLNAQIPPGARSGALSLVVLIGGNSSQQGVTVSVK